jgi:hypothetical protein
VKVRGNPGNDSYKNDQDFPACKEVGHDLANHVPGSQAGEDRSEATQDRKTLETLPVIFAPLGSSTPWGSTFIILSM